LIKRIGGEDLREEIKGMVYGWFGRGGRVMGCLLGFGVGG
jgi:hypothetical protein